MVSITDVSYLRFSVDQMKGIKFTSAGRTYYIAQYIMTMVDIYQFKNNCASYIATDYLELKLLN
jgi:hypothetical protein